MYQKLLGFSLIFTAGLAVLVTITSATQVPGHRKKMDRDGNGIADEGVVVNGHYTSLFAYEGAYGSGAYPEENWYWDLGDGRILGTVDSVEDLDQDRLTTCDYQVNYRGTFENDPFMDTGWIQNHINCTGPDDNGTYNYNIVHETDRRYTGDPEFAVWGNWEYQVLTEKGKGNLARPKVHLNSHLSNK